MAIKSPDQALSELKHHHGHEHNHDKKFTISSKEATSQLDTAKDSTDKIVNVWSGARARIVELIPELGDTCLDHLTHGCGGCEKAGTTRVVDAQTQKEVVIANAKTLKEQFVNIAAEKVATLTADEQKEIAPAIDAIAKLLDQISVLQEEINKACVCCCADHGGITGNPVSGVKGVSSSGKDMAALNTARESLANCGNCPHKSGCQNLLSSLAAQIRQSRPARKRSF